MSPATDSVAARCNRLLVLRADALQQLANADHLGAGPLVTLANVEAVLAALAPDLEPAARAIVSDDGSTMWLTVYTVHGDGAAAS